jgi:hypothetical protein
LPPRYSSSASYALGEILDELIERVANLERRTVEPGIPGWQLDGLKRSNRKGGKGIETLERSKKKKKKKVNKNK